MADVLGEIVALEKKRQTKPLSESDEARLQRATTELERVIRSGWHQWFTFQPFSPELG